MDRLSKVGESRLLGLACLSVLAGVLMAGLWPFWPPQNDVTWLENADGLRFGNYGTVLSSGNFPAPTAQQGTSCTVELWVEPGPTSGSTDFVSFSTPEHPRQISLEQYHDSFLLLRQTQRHPPHIPLSSGIVGIAGVFREKKPRFITVTSGPKRTSIYIDGVLGESSQQLLLAEDLTGRLVIGTASIVAQHWGGELRGLAVYDGELTAAEVLANYEVWTTQGRPPLYGDPRAIAIYAFNEHAGNIIHNAVRPGIDLYIPRRFSLLHQAFLEAFWRQYDPSWSYWKDILVNVAGFIPLGFFFCAYWSSVRSIKRAAFATVVFGFAVSLTIEVSQAYLPTRASDTTDVITNTLGTLIGVLVYGWGFARETIRTWEQWLLSRRSDSLN